MKTGKIIVERIRRISERKYSVGIYIDNELIVNTIKENRHEIELECGKHILKVEQGIRSGEIEINVDSDNVMKYTFTSTPLSYLIYIIFLLPITANILFEIKGPVLGLFFFPGIISLIYSYTAGKKKYYQFKSELYSTFNQIL
jgi:hypothetical protein